MIAEFIKIRQSDNPPEIALLGEKIKGQIVEFLATLDDRLEHSGNTQQLELKTDLHEMLQSRLFVAKRVLDLELPIKFLQHLTKPVFTPGEASQSSCQENPNATITRQTTFASKESSQSRFLEFFNSRFSSDKGSGDIQAQFTNTAQQKQVYTDKGPYAAAYQLAMLTSVVMEHHAAQERADFSSEEEQQKQFGRASFDGRDLPDKPLPKVRDIARSPEAIREKLDARKNQVQAVAKATFFASDSTHSFRGEIEKLAAEKQRKAKQKS